MVLVWVRGAGTVTTTNQCAPAAEAAVALGIIINNKSLNVVHTLGAVGFKPNPSNNQKPTLPHLNALQPLSNPTVVTPTGFEY